jgi:hypothetical protein
MMRDEIRVGRMYTDGSSFRRVLGIYPPLEGIRAPVIVEFIESGKVKLGDLRDFALWSRRSTRKNFFPKAFQKRAPAQNGEDTQ